MKREKTSQDVLCKIYQSAIMFHGYFMQEQLDVLKDLAQYDLDKIDDYKSVHNQCLPIWLHDKLDQSGAEAFIKDTHTALSRIRELVDSFNSTLTAAVEDYIDSNPET